MEMIRIPTDDRILSIPLARCGEFDLTPPEMQRTRRFIYSLNKSHVHGWRWRTMRENNTLLVWRIK
jgi:hypothetical protein